ncbi:geranylgeranylglycerol-phosphate geranylgeranyltransferase, partial [Candidatus Bathyarchaeota archaeon]|nr:geranylgeranylglycerol-phosphate geranylgeranyltransferase [Candidatus Bathyarchaeota archaeon]
MKKLAGFIRLIRPANCIMMGFAVIVGAAIANYMEFLTKGQNLIFGFLTGFLLTAASMAINDYYDKEIDAVNEPDRPIPSGIIKPSEALALTLILIILGLTAAFLTNPSALSCFITAILFLFISMAYVTVGKRTGLLGNFLVSACVSAPFIYGSLAVDSIVPLKTWIFVAMVFLSNTGREITKGIVDVPGDKERNVKTLAVRFGERKAALASAAFYLFAVALTPLPWLLGIVSIWFIPFVLVTNLGLIASSLMLLKDYSRERARKIKNQVLAWFFIGLIAFLA